MFLEFVAPLLAPGEQRAFVRAKLSAGVPSNHGRSEFVAARVEQGDGDAVATPVRGKSGLISQLSVADGFFVVPRNCEGLPVGAEVEVHLFR